MTSLQDKLVSLYGTDTVLQHIHDRLVAFRAQHSGRAARQDDFLSERDVVLITYGNSLYEPEHPPLQTLHDFLRQTLRGIISIIHILPFFPYSSDDGFSVIDYTAVDPALGTWDDIQHIGQDFKLMFDGVFNHLSAHSDWFRRFRADDPDYRNFFITVDPSTDLSAVVRPRNLPLLTPVETDRGTAHVWTTFSADQIDLNFANPDVLVRMIDVLLFYVEQGAEIIRLDAIAYLWKEPGTPSIHLPQTHTVIQVLREVLDQVAPQVILITETNVPHAENLSYFGDGTNEAQLVYQFTLPPLVLHSIATGSAVHLSEWAAGIKPIAERATFLNFTASHDGIGVRPLEGILAREDVNRLIERTEQHGGAVSYKTNPDGSLSPYELNINYFDALSNPDANEPLDQQVRRFLVSQAIQLAFVGVPAVYIHSLLGSRNWTEGVRQTGQLRSINREKLQWAEIKGALDTPGSLRKTVFDTYRHLIQVRCGEAAFHPVGQQEIVHLHPSLFTLLRFPRDGSLPVVAIHNVADRTVRADLRDIPLPYGHYVDLLGEQPVETGVIEIEPYQVLWLKAQEG